MKFNETPSAQVCSRLWGGRKVWVVHLTHKRWSGLVMAITIVTSQCVCARAQVRVLDFSSV